MRKVKFAIGTLMLTSQTPALLSQQTPQTQHTHVNTRQIVEKTKKKKPKKSDTTCLLGENASIALTIMFLLQLE